MMKDTDNAIARVSISCHPEMNEFRAIHNHHLKTFKIDADRISLLSVMHLDAKTFHFETGGREGPAELHEWLVETHPHSCKSISENEFRRWSELFYHLQYNDD